MIKVLSIVEFYPNQDCCRKIDICDNKKINEVIRLVYKSKRKGTAINLFKTNPGDRFISLTLASKNEPSKILRGYSVTGSTLSVFENGEKITYWTGCADLQNHLLGLLEDSPKITMREWKQYTIKCLYIRNLYDVLRNILEVKKQAELSI